MARPCLVRQSFVSSTKIKGKDYDVGYVDVFFGTKQIDKYDPPQGFHIDDNDEKNAGGLKFDTVFDLLDHEILPWSPAYFSDGKGKAIVAGHFTDAMIARLKAQAQVLKDNQKR
ncbi:hypothetical protein N2601_31170 (plasmid) [Rhizobium sp. CB3060]|uniref:hypothetical protein n=1 Tax=Rhizobium sp. CB3060 TaxID=3138255 RepID=UPI0021A4C61D|nr:hypothetical protein [Rhizobium tropici]UWU25451.1 hypothetical protein N2601_31170 [Rhizobium tropici]